MHLLRVITGRKLRVLVESLCCTVNFSLEKNFWAKSVKFEKNISEKRFFFRRYENIVQRNESRLSYGFKNIRRLDLSLFGGRARNDLEIQQNKRG